MKKIIRLGLVVAVVALVAVFTPKPQLLKYGSANIVSEAIYWDSFGASGVLSDANADFVKYDRETQHLHICYGKNTQANCQDYQVIENKGMLAAFWHWLNNHT